MEIQQVALTELHPSDYNPRKMSTEDMESLKRSMTEFGITEPIIANKDGTIISGHQRYEAARQLAIASLPVHFVDLPKDKERILNVAMNRIHGEFDMAILPDLMQLIAEGERMLTGFQPEEISIMLTDFQPSTLEEQGKLTEKSPVTCPKCGHVFQA